MKFMQIKKLMIDLFFPKCKHKSVDLYNGDNYCPNCGKRIKNSWIVIRCQQCKKARTPHLNKIGDISPLNKFCPNCGSEKWFSEKVENSNNADIFFGIALKEEVVESVFNYDSKSRTEVWVEKTTPKSKNNFHKNIIKAKKNKGNF